MSITLVQTSVATTDYDENRINRQTPFTRKFTKHQQQSGKTREIVDIQRDPPRPVYRKQVPVFAINNLWIQGLDRERRFVDRPFRPPALLVQTTSVETEKKRKKMFYFIM